SGKMLRGIFVLLSYEMFGGVINKDILNVAAVMELNQAALLIHDDIMDNDTVRRGGRTMYAEYMNDARVQNIENPEEYGKSMAMIVADLSLFLTYDLIGSLNIPISIMSQVMKIYSKEMLKVGRGQFMDYHFGKTPDFRSEADITLMYQLKTGSYTFSLPFILGALMARASKKDREVLEKITTFLGIIFQIKDDELGLFGKTEDTGKSPGADLQENKKTLHIAMLLTKASESEKEKIKRILGKPVSQEDVDYVYSLMNSYGILEEIELKVNTISHKANESLIKLSLNAPFHQLFQELIIYNATRER
ncbi:MAG: polyprenyl synthetase family protein, partial [Microgenomates group bacterium]